MKSVNLFRYIRPDGGVTVSTTVPADGVDYTVLYRIVADEGLMLVKNGEVRGVCADTDSLEGWEERAEEPNDSASIEDYHAALAQMGVILND